MTEFPTRCPLSAPFPLGSPLGRGRTAGPVSCDGGHLIVDTGP